MRFLAIPSTDLNVSVLSLGAGSLGTRTPKDQAFEMLDLYVDLGGNFLDTAHIYAAWTGDGWGASERTLGEWIRSRCARSRVVIGTKGGHPHLQTMQISRLSQAEIMQDLDESLQRLGVDVIDLYWLHRDDPLRPVGDMIETLHDAAQRGKIRYYGCSNWSVPRMQEAQDYAAAQGRMGFVASQPGWSLAIRNVDPMGDPTSRFMDPETYAFHLRTGLPAVAYSSQANGFFTGAYGRNLQPPAPGVNPGVFRAYASETNFARLDRCRALAARYQCTPNDIALGYLTSQPFPTCAILGCGTLAHLRESMTARDLSLTAEECGYLEG